MRSVLACICAAKLGPIPLQGTGPRMSAGAGLQTGVAAIWAARSGVRISAGKRCSYRSARPFFARFPHVAISHQRRDPFLVRSMNSQRQSSGGHCFRRPSSSPGRRSSAAHAMGPTMRSSRTKSSRTGVPTSEAAARRRCEVADRGQRLRRRRCPARNGYADRFTGAAQMMD